MSVSEEWLITSLCIKRKCLRNLKTLAHVIDIGSQQRLIPVSLTPPLFYSRYFHILTLIPLFFFLGLYLEIEAQLLYSLLCLSAKPPKQPFFISAVFTVAGSCRFFFSVFFLSSSGIQLKQSLGICCHRRYDSSVTCILSFKQPQ